MNKVNTWFTSDTHFGHANIIKYSNRPFKSVEEMDEAMIKNWNETVGPNDWVYHLGDFSFKPAKNYVDRLNGRIVFIHGNHDRDTIAWNEVEHKFLWSLPMMEIKIEGHGIVLCHYAMRVWNKCHRGNLHFFGHSHGQMPGNSLSTDVGVDCWDYRPVSLERIKKRLEILPKFVPEDYHGE